jgi:hypothetical protein
LISDQDSTNVLAPHYWGPELPEKRSRKKKVSRYPHEETWLREFVGYYGAECTTSFSDDDLNGVSLTAAIEALARGSVISAEKCDDRPGTVCVVEYRTEENSVVSVTVHFVSNEHRMRFLRAQERKESDSETDHAA